MADEVVLPIPNLKLAQYWFTIVNKHDGAEDAKRELMKGIEADEMAPYYHILISQSSDSGFKDTALLERLEAANTAALEKFDTRLKEAEETEGETEISDTLRAKADYLTKIGDKDRAVTALDLALMKTAGLGSRIDIVLTLVRIGLFFGDHKLVDQNLEKAELLIREGGDWDRLNRHKVYLSLSSLTCRKFDRKTADLLIDSLSTFTATELLDYNDLVTIAVIVGTLVLPRPDLKKRIIDSPEVNQVLPEVPTLADFTKSLYHCEYAKFFVSLATMEKTHLLTSRLLSPHARFYIREMRILAYTQILESYRSLTLPSLSQAFGVSIEFIDHDLSRFISSGRLNCTIDKVHGIVETNRPSTKNAQYETVVRQGDVLLNSVQRLSRVLY